MNESEDRPTLSVRTPEDLIALAPILLGFEPQESLVMLTFSARRQFHARVSLPSDPEVCEHADHLEDQAFYDGIVASLLGPAVQHGVEAVALLVFTEHLRGQEVSSLAAATAVEAFGAAGICVFEALRVSRGHWSGLMDRGDESRGAALAAHHHLETASVVSGRVTHRSRAELAATLDPDPAGQDAVEKYLMSPAGRGCEWPTREIAGYLASGKRIDDACVARIAAASATDPLDSVTWAWLERSEAAAAVTMFSDVVRRCPAGHVCGPATILAYAAWLAGEGALAWCAVERAYGSGETSANLLAIEVVLTDAVSPEEWPKLRSALAAA